MESRPRLLEFIAKLEKETVTYEKEIIHHKSS